MGLGSDPCGQSPCGLDNQTPSVARTAKAPAALDFDGEKRDFRLDDEGQYVAAHPVDAKVFLIVRTALRSIRSAPNLGQTVGDIAYIDQRTIRSNVESRLRGALAPVVAAGEIRILGIELDTSVRGRIVAAVHYENLVTRKRDRVARLSA